MIDKKTILLVGILFSQLVLADASVISNSGGASLLGNVSVGTVQSKGSLHVNGTIYQNPLTPIIIGNFSDAQLSGVSASYVSGRYAFVNAAFNRSLNIFDISNPYKIERVGYITDPIRFDRINSIVVSGKYAYIGSSGNDSFNVLDISNISSPVLVASLTDRRFDELISFQISGKYAYVTAFNNRTVSIVDISNPVIPVIVGNITDNVKFEGLAEIFVSGKYAYVTTVTNDSLSVIDISNVTSPKIIGYLTDSIRMEWANGIYISGRYAYVVSSINDSLSIIDISNVTSPVITGHLTSKVLDSVNRVVVAGKYAYVTSALNDSLSVIDVSVPASPVLVGSTYFDARMNNPGYVYVSGKYAYVSAGDSTSFNVLDIGGIESPSAAIGAIQTNSLVADELSVGNDLYVGSLNVGPGGAYFGGPLSVYGVPDNKTTGALLTVGNSTTSLVAVFGQGTGKIDAGLVDPVYTINGRQYATYLPAMTGVKEETTGTLKLNCLGNLCRYTIDFNSLEEGSDLWLFSKTTSLKKNFDKLSVLLTSESGLVWYEKDAENNRLMVFGENPGTVHYRLTAPRFDAEKWSNYNSDGLTGYVIE